MSESGRRDVTALLTKAAIGYWVKKKYAVHTEMGILPRGRRKVDLFTFNLRGDLVICEVKSGWADYKTDTKWQEYLPMCQRFYFVVATEALAERIAEHLGKNSPAGIMYLQESSGLLYAYRSARRREVEGAIRRKLITRCAWRTGYNASNTRRVRVYLPEEV